MNAQRSPVNRCPRCDEPHPPHLKHRCPHKNDCAPFTQPGHCSRCREFKKRQLSWCEEPDPRPFLKWAGGKHRALQDLLPFVPIFKGRYFEPFLGGGAMFFFLRPQTAILSDANERLIRTYRAVRDEPSALIDLLRSFPVQEEFFYRMRDRNEINKESDLEVAAWMIYLNKTCFNGLYRVNSKNNFNVSWGKKSPSHKVFNESNLLACSAALKHAKLKVQGFDRIENECDKGDFVFLDPPYLSDEKSDFTSYTPGGFTIEDQERLRDLAVRLKRRGVHVMIMNRDSQAARSLFDCEPLMVHSIDAKVSMSSKGSSRGKRSDLVIV